MKIVFAAFASGIVRVLRAPALLAGVFLATFLLALPARHLVEADLQAALGHSRAGDTMLSGADTEWWDRYLEGASGLSRSFTLHVIGFAAVLDNTSRVLDNQRGVPAVAALGAAYVGLWLFLAGGIIDRLARNRAVRTQAFFGACGVFAWRFLRLGAVAAAGYLLLFGPVHRGLFGGVYGLVAPDLAVERTAFALRVALYVVFAGLLAAWTLLLDYAKIRAVVEDRRSMLGAFLAGSRFVIRHPLKTGLLWLLNAAVLLAVVGAYAMVAPGAADPGGRVWAAFAAGQAYVVARVFLKLLTWSSQAALFQSMQAHAATYAGLPLPVWAEPPVVEAVAPPPRTP